VFTWHQLGHRQQASHQRSLLDAGSHSFARGCAHLYPPKEGCYKKMLGMMQWLVDTCKMMASSFYQVLCLLHFQKKGLRAHLAMQKDLNYHMHFMVE
jgi:hypothetical protein